MSRVRFLIVVIAFALSFLFAAIPHTFAENEPARADASGEKKAVMTTVATVNVQDMALIHQENNVLTITFRLSNEEGVQPSIIYAVNLLRKESDGKATMIAQTVYTEDMLSLAANSNIHKQIIYTAPNFLSGEYFVEIEARNQDALLFGSVRLRDPVTFSGTDKYIDIDQSSCFLTIDGEQGDTKYTLLQGVDITPEETLKAHCRIKNFLGIDAKVSAALQTRFRSVFGKMVGIERQQAFDLKKDESTEMVVSLPRISDSQAYDTVLRLVNESNETLSLPIVFHYVVRGESATVQNLTLDKDRYDSGEIAKVSFFWTASADNFPDSRFPATNIANKKFIVLTLKDGEGAVCSEPLAHALENTDQSGTKTALVSIVKDCLHPRVQATIQTDEGKVLAERDYAIESVEKKQTLKGSFMNVLAYLGGFFVILLLLFFLIRKNKSVAESALVGLILFGGVLIGTHSAEANSYTIQFPYDNLNNHEITINGTIGLDKSSYTPGETMFATTRFNNASCANNDPRFCEKNPNVCSGSSIKTTFDINGQGSEVWGDAVNVPVTAPSVPGTYSLTYTVSRYWWPNTYSDSGTQHFTVVAPAINGQCGGANGKNYASTVTSYPDAQCNAGNSSNTAFPNPGQTVSWTCSGTNGGSPSPQCSASRQEQIPAPTASLRIYEDDVNSDYYKTRGWFIWVPALITNHVGYRVQSTNADSCSIDRGVGSVGKQSEGLFTAPQPEGDTRYTLTCTNASGSATDTVTVRGVVSSTPINGQCGGANGKNYASTVTSYPDAQCNAGNSSNTAFPNPGQTVSWTCSGTNGGSPSPQCSASRQAASNPPDPTLFMSVSNETPVWNGSTTVYWDAYDVSSCAYVKSGSGSSSMSPSSGSLNASGSYTDTNIQGQVIYTITCQGNKPNTHVSRSVEVVSGNDQTPTLSLSANPLTIDSGDSSTITWTPANSNWCWGWAGSNQGGGAWYDSSNGGHTLSVSPTSTTTYSMKCGNSDAGLETAIKSVTVEVVSGNDQTPTLSLSANPLTIDSGDSSTITWTPANSNWCWGWAGSNQGGGAWYDSSNGGHTLSVSPTSTTTYSMKCGNSDAGLETAIKSVTVTVNGGGSCVPDWTPDPSSKCPSETVTQTDGCGNTRQVAGTNPNCGSLGSIAYMVCPRNPSIHVGEQVQYTGYFSTNVIRYPDELTCADPAAYNYYQTNDTRWDNGNMNYHRMDNGLATGIASGSESVSAYGMRNGKAVSDYGVRITVLPNENPTLKICPSSVTVQVGSGAQTESWYGTGSCADHTGDTQVTNASDWTSANAGIATVSNQVNVSRGYITGVSAGNTTVNASYSGKSASASVTVTTGGSCTDTSWTPDPSTVCTGTAFTQTSNCGNTRARIGTKPGTWIPPIDPAQVCSGSSVTQKNSCGGATRNISGTKDCSGPKWYEIAPIN